MPIRLLSTGPGRSNIFLALLRAIAQARSSIDLQLHEIDAPELELALIRAHARGVRVRVLLDPWSVVTKFAAGIRVPVAVPLSWEELESQDERPLYALRELDAATARRLQRAWRDYDGVRQSLRTSSTGRVSGRTPRHR